MRLASVLLCAALFAPVGGHAQGFHPTDNCVEIIESSTDVERIMMASWVVGYLDRVNGSNSLIRLDNAQVVLRNVTAFCRANPDASLLQVVQSSQRDSPAIKGTKSNARAFLAQFLRADADLVILTAQMRPTEDDIRAVYAPPLAERLIPHYAGLFTPNARIGPKPGQTDVLVWRGTTDSLRRGDPILQEFPGGYEQVRPFLLGNHPIVRFKFVKPGETRGLAFDGLVHVNGRWVLMPKPWRVLQN